jgi:hypothetical protein
MVVRQRAEGGFADFATGTTANAYAAALTWKCVGYHRKTIILKNTHGANQLKFKVLVFDYPGGNEYELVAETALDAADLSKLVFNDAYARIVLQVKSSIADTHATYQVDYTGLT